MDIAERIKKFLLSLAVLFLNTVKWITIIFFSLAVIFFLEAVVISGMHIRAKSVTITEISNQPISVTLPLKVIPVKGNSAGSRLLVYHLKVRKFWGTVWSIGYIPEEKRVFLASSCMSFFTSFLYHYTITDPKAEQALLELLKEIKPYNTYTYK